MQFTDIFIYLGAFLLSYRLFLPTIKLSNATGAIDIPGERRVHSHPTSRLGGFEFFLAFSIFFALSSARYDEKIAILCACGVIFLVGFFDDTIALSPFQKLFGQFLASAVYILLLPGAAQIGAFLGAILIFWTIFMCNAINLIDGLDGLAGGISISAAISLSSISLILGDFATFKLCFLLIFCILGFLPHNFHNAKIFMGDCGSLFLGFVLSCASSKLMLSFPTAKTAIAIILIFLIPILDTTSSVIRRLLRGKSPFCADRGHFHHKLIDFGLSKDCASLLLITISLFLGLFGIIICI